MMWGVTHSLYPSYWERLQRSLRWGSEGLMNSPLYTPFTTGQVILHVTIYLYLLCRINRNLISCDCHMICLSVYLSLSLVLWVICSLPKSCASHVKVMWGSCECVCVRRGALQDGFVSFLPSLPLQLLFPSLSPPLCPLPRWTTPSSLTVASLPPPIPMVVMISLATGRGTPSGRSIWWARTVSLLKQLNNKWRSMPLTTCWTVSWSFSPSSFAYRDHNPCQTCPRLHGDDSWVRRASQPPPPFISGCRGCLPLPPQTLSHPWFLNLGSVPLPLSTPPSSGFVSNLQWVLSFCRVNRYWHCFV